MCWVAVVLHCRLHFVFLPTFSGHICSFLRLQFTIHRVHPGTGGFVMRDAVSQWQRWLERQAACTLHSDVCASVFQHKPNSKHQMYCALTSLYGNCSRERDVQVVRDSWWLQFDSTPPLHCFTYKCSFAFFNATFFSSDGWDGVTCYSRHRVSDSPGCCGRCCDDCCLRGCYAVPSVLNLTTFRRNVLSHC